MAGMGIEASFGGPVEGCQYFGEPRQFLLQYLFAPITDNNSPKTSFGFQFGSRLARKKNHISLGRK